VGHGFQTPTALGTEEKDWKVRRDETDSGRHRAMQPAGGEGRTAGEQDYLGDQQEDRRKIQPGPADQIIRPTDHRIRRPRSGARRFATGRAAVLGSEQFGTTEPIAGYPVALPLVGALMVEEAQSEASEEHGAKNRYH
jgi:hypothetical protein